MLTVQFLFLNILIRLKYNKVSIFLILELSQIQHGVGDKPK